MIFKGDMRHAFLSLHVSPCTCAAFNYQPCKTAFLTNTLTDERVYKDKTNMLKLSFFINECMCSQASWALKSVQALLLYDSICQ